MAIIGDALPKHEYASLREEDRALIKLQRPLLMSTLGFICCVIFTCTVVSSRIVFSSNVLRRRAFYLTDQETVVDFYWMVVAGGVRCLSILNVVFAIILRSPSYISRLKPPDTRKQLRRAALTNDEGEFGNRNHQGLEMLEANPLEFTPDVERKHGWIHLCYHLMKKTNLSITMKFPQDHDS
uniref:Uncharacterized protein n=1 Tax=Brassica campestris TaxID=3711 RepID=M4F7I3_BRACM